MDHTNRIVVLVDMDCFYCQVEEKLDPTLEGKPIAVVQYNAWRGGGIIAVNYPARDKGVTRHMRGDEARQKCPDIILARVPEVRGKADLTKYREAGKKVAEVLQAFTNILERASVDEAYLDISQEVFKRLETRDNQIKIENLPNTFVVGCDINNFVNNLKADNDFCESNVRLAIGGIITEEIRAEILNRTGYKCSAGVAHNKILAKLVCGLNKPNKQTLLPYDAISELYKDLPIKKIRSLGGKYGDTLIEKLQISTMGQLAQFSEKELSKNFDEKHSKWLFNIAKGIDLDPVTVRLVSKSIGCCKRFPGKTALTTSVDVEHWMKELSFEISERLDKDRKENNRTAKQMVVSFTQELNGKEQSSTRTHPLPSYEQPKIYRNAFDVVRRFCLRADGSYYLTFLGLSAGNFHDLKNSTNISTFFTKRLKETLVEEKQPNSSNLTTENSKTKSFFHTWVANQRQPEDKGDPDQKENKSFSHTQEELKKVSPQIKVGLKSETAELRTESDRVTKKSFFHSWVSKNYEGRTSDNHRKDILSKEAGGSEKPIKSFFMNYLQNEGNHVFNKNIDTDETWVQNKPKMLEWNGNYSGCGEKCNTMITSTEFEKHMINPQIKEMQKSEPMEFKESSKPHLPTSQLPISESQISDQLIEIDEEKHSKLSVYSADTEELNEDSKNLIYFEDVFSESDSREPLFKVHGNQKDTLGNEAEETQCEDEKLMSKFSNCPESPKDETIKPVTTPFRQENHLNKQTCADCNKKIPSSEYLSHMDYHFALKMVKEESHLYQNSITSNEKPSKSTNKKTLKRKLVQSKQMLSFLQQPTSAHLDENNSKLCTECNKRIKLDEILGHADYHAAKKLHLELNSPKKVDSSVKNKKNKDVKNIKHISNYFKT